MLTITIDTVKGDNQINWDGTPEEFRNLWDGMEELAAIEGHDPRNVANTAIHAMATRGKPNDAVQQRGLERFIVYAVLCHVADNVDISKMVDYAGVITGPPTVFDLAAHQHITAKIRVHDNKITIDLAGRSPLDS